MSHISTPLFRPRAESLHRADSRVPSLTKKYLPPQKRYLKHNDPQTDLTNQNLRKDYPRSRNHPESKEKTKRNHQYSTQGKLTNETTKLSTSIPTAQPTPNHSERHRADKNYTELMEAPKPHNQIPDTKTYPKPY